MEFFNKKEDVIDLQLTNFGRHLLSKGRFKPVFYSFFDDNILYNSKNAGFQEEQNASEERIREAQSIQTQACFSSLDREFNTLYEMTLSGSSAHLTLEEKTGGKNTMAIPQLETVVEIKAQHTFNPGEDLPELLDGPALSNVVVVSDEKDYFVLLKVMEGNGLFQKKNFDVEMFEVVEQKEGDKTIEELRPLYFTTPFDPENELDMLDNTTPIDSHDHIAHYFDLRIDDEIDSKVLCEYDEQNTKLGVFADERTAICQDVLNRQENTAFNIYEAGTQDVPGEIC